jgi:hypothetical protein
MKLRWPIPLPIVHTNQTPSDYRSSLSSLPPPAGWLADCCRRPVAHRPNSDASGSIQCTRWPPRSQSICQNEPPPPYKSSFFFLFLNSFSFLKATCSIWFCLRGPIYIRQLAGDPFHLSNVWTREIQRKCIALFPSTILQTTSYIPWNNCFVALHYRWAPLQPRISSI